MSNNNVVENRSRYELHALEYLKTRFLNHDVEIMGHTKPGTMAKDFMISAKNGDIITIECKGSQIIDIDKGKPRLQRFKLKERDYAGTNMADYFLFILNTEQLGFKYESCGYCGSFDCAMQYIFMKTEEVLELIPDVTKSTYKLPITKLLKQGGLLNGD